MELVLAEISSDLVERVEGRSLLLLNLLLVLRQRGRRLRLLLVDELYHRIEDLLLREALDLHGEFSGELTRAVVGGWGKILLQDLGL